MDIRIRRRLLALEIAVIAGCAAFLAHATAGAFEMTALTPPPIAARPAAAARVTPGPLAAKTAVLERNIFCSTCPPPSARPDAPVADVAPRATTLPLTLVAVMDYDRKGKKAKKDRPSPAHQRLAVVRATDDGSMGAYAVGETLRDATITGIDETRVHLRREERAEWLDLLPEKTGATASATADASAETAPSLPPRPMPATERPSAMAQELDRGIKKLGEGSYEVQRSTLESILGNMSELGRAARIMPDQGGLRLTSVRNEGPLARIGLQNGDLLVSINGLDITKPERALDAYVKLRSASHVALAVERGGRKMTMNYAVR